MEQFHSFLIVPIIHQLLMTQFLPNFTANSLEAFDILSGILRCSGKFYLKVKTGYSF